MFILYSLIFVAFSSLQGITLSKIKDRSRFDITKDRYSLVCFPTSEEPRLMKE